LENKLISMEWLPELISRWQLGRQYGYHKYFREQDRRPVGKPGIILSDLGMPEEYRHEFYLDFMNHVFEYSLPVFLKPFILADRGLALIDPANPLARESFVPERLVDMKGSFCNREGRPYVECKVTWHPPGLKKNPFDHGYFLYRGDGKGGAPEISQKTGAKVVGWYYGHLLPEKRVAWEYQCMRIFEEAGASLRERFPHAEIRHARYSSGESLHRAVEDLLSVGCETIVYQSFCHPVYSDFEDYAYSLPKIHRFVNKRARFICADQLGNQPAMQEAFVQVVRDNLACLPASSRVLLILSRHGHPFKRDTQDIRGAEFRMPLEASMRAALEAWGGPWELVWSDDEYADDHCGSRNGGLSTYSAYRKAIGEGFDYALEVPTDFIAENTDLMILHAMKKFRAFSSYDQHDPVPYPDWEAPLVRTFREGPTTGLYLGCPVGPYRKHVVESVVASVSGILQENSSGK
jgi:hypothetical protein